LHCKSKKGKKVKEKFVSMPLKNAFPETWIAGKFAMFKNFIHSQLLKPIFLSPNHGETQITKNYQTSKKTFLP